MVKLEMLEIDLLLGSHSFYHDDGFVDSIKEYEQCLLDKYGIEQKACDTLAIGRAFFYSVGSIERAHIYYLSTDPISDAQVRGHEETHVLEYFDSLDLLSKKLLDERGLRVDLKKIDDTEIVAYIGGIYSVLKSGYTFPMLQNVHYHSKLREARNILECSRV